MGCTASKAGNTEPAYIPPSSQKSIDVDNGGILEDDNGGILQQEKTITDYERPDRVGAFPHITPPLVAHNVSITQTQDRDEIVEPQSPRDGVTFPKGNPINRKSADIRHRDNINNPANRHQKAFEDQVPMFTQTAFPFAVGETPAASTHGGESNHDSVRQSNLEPSANGTLGTIGSVPTLGSFSAPPSISFEDDL